MHLFLAGCTQCRWSDVGQNCPHVQEQAGTDREEGQRCCRGNDTKDKGTGANGDGRKDEREAVPPSLDALTSSRTSTTTGSIQMSQLLLKHISSSCILSPLKFSPGDELKDAVPPPTSARKVSRIQLLFFLKFPFIFCTTPSVTFPQCSCLSGLRDDGGTAGCTYALKCRSGASH